MIYLGLGSNLGNRLENIHKAYEYLTYSGEIEKKSPVYESEALTLPDDTEAQNRYLNSVIEFDTDLTIHALLYEIKSIEKAIGTRFERKWGPRYMDIDILIYHKVIISDENITIPHPEMRKRAFVLKPLIDIAGPIKLPPDNIPAAKLLGKLVVSELKYFADE